MSTAALMRRERHFHETWLGMVQPVEGLVLSVPTLVDAQCAERQPAHAQRDLEALLVPAGPDAAPDAPRALTDLGALLRDLLGWAPPELLSPDDLDAHYPDLALWVPEGRQLLRPTYALRDPFFDPAAPRPADRGPAPDTPAALAADDLLLLVWDLPPGLDLDAPETTTGEWRYPPVRKFERLLRHARVPLGLLANGHALRLVYAPHGESVGTLTFRLADMAHTGGRPILDALRMLLTADALFADPARALPALCRQSRARQADVTDELARQVFDALTLLLEGFEAAAARGDDADRQALLDALDDADDDHLYAGLLAVLLRLVFVLYAEDNGILPVDHPVYAQHLSVLGLHAQLTDDAGAYPDSMDRRFGAWPRLLALFRAVHAGLAHGDLNLPPRRGRLFDPDAYPFLEGRPRAGALQSRADVRTPRLDDGTVFAVLERLLLLHGARLSYRALDVEQIGSVYERLMGYRVERLDGPAVLVRAGAAACWLSTEAVAAVRPADRVRWLTTEWGLDKSAARKLAAALADLRPPFTNDDLLAVLDTARHPTASGPTRKPALALVLQPGKERIRTSSHYTPRALSQPIVARTLAPVIAALGDAPTAEQLLALKVCDPAMGSGAFLVEACRHLGDHVVAAWARHGELEAIGEQVDDPTVYARRLVAQRCLYGVDKNRFAVDLARIALWLVTLARDEPFTFVDHALRHGDTLVGLGVEAIRRFDWEVDRAKQIDFFYRGLDDAIAAALDRREEILELAREEGAGMSWHKERLLRDAEDALRVPRLVGDALVGAWFAHAKDKDKDEERRRRLAVIAAWLESDEPAVHIPPEVAAWQAELRAHTPAFHWPLELPEVFHTRRPDPLDGGALNAVAMMDAFIGNPPFAGKSAITASAGEGYIKWLQQLHAKSHGNADLSAHFFRRAADLLGAHGTLGLIATNTIAQGDTRATGLQHLVCDHEFVIYDATQDMAWPGDAAVTIDVVHLATGTAARHIGECHLDGVAVAVINSRLRPGPERPDPVKLAQNAGWSYQGTVVLGMGFTLTPDERDELVARDARNAERVFPYLGGQELNSDPRQEPSRYVISFGDLPLEDAERWPDLIARVRQLVKPERDRLKDNSDGRRRKAYWWQPGRWTPALYAALARLDRCLANSQVSKHLIFAWQPTDRIFAHTLYVYPLDRDAHLALLQSRVHEGWARLLSSSMKTDLRYGAGDCFETFPFPPEAALAVGGALDEAGRALHEARAALCLARDCGLTPLYNALKDPADDDPEVAHLRALHEAVDRAVIAAYGWSAVPVPTDGDAPIPLIDAVPPFATPDTDEARRAAQRFEDVVIDRLFALNAERAKEEAHPSGTPRPTRGKPTGSKKAKVPRTPDGQEKLL